MSGSQSGSASEKRKEKITFFADIALKLSPVIATLVLGFVTYQFQSKNAAANLLNQREQAETQLRTKLFENLIGPVGGSNDGEFDAYRQRLFVELLMLNFHEHIEFKPLLIHTDQRLVAELVKFEQADAETKADAEEQIDQARRSLQSVTRRVRDRQASILAKECSRGLREQRIIIGDDLNPCEPISEIFLGSDSAFENDKTWEVWSPKQEYKLVIRVMKMNWEKLKFDVEIQIFKNDHSDIEFVRDSSFSITPFDLPFTDNMVIAGHQRFALGVSNIAPRRTLEDTELSESETNKESFITIQTVWFPEGYILPHERPVNYTEIRNMLNLDDE